MKLAFYAPLKPADHPTPSGDRAMARALLSALSDGGHQANIASDLRSFEPSGSATAQRNLMTKAASEIERLIPIGKRQNWAAWVTYHNYYKAPDLIGPKVAAALGIPYLLVEATRAKKRLGGPWDVFAQAAETACDAASAIFFVTERDAQSLRRDAPDDQQLIHLHPFLDRSDLPEMSTCKGNMLSVAMMRQGDKLASYKLIAETLAKLPDDMQHIDIVGDGAARADVETLFAPFAQTVTFHGALDAPALATLYSQAKLLFWPGVNEAFGLTYLEAQAAGVPVVAQDRPGVCDVTFGPQPSIDAGPAGMAQAITKLMQDPDHHHRQSTGARAFVAQAHLRPFAAQTLHNVLTTLTRATT
ncbi:glycosyltransferase [Pseudosulfitobacter sp. SM2401]|uniref:glycosyltransferase family 4 protein n=1 Tax=Pseudosulfitobacter sp. SM2401 TaxID=3350098 RepID=UPI0036F3C7A5